MVGNMYGMRNGMRPEEQPAKRLKPSQVQAVMKGNHGTSLVEAMGAEEIQSHLENLRVRTAGPWLCAYSGAEYSWRSCLSAWCF